MLRAVCAQATVDDGSCILPKPGCTIPNASYHGVDPATPMFQKRYYGSSERNVGLIVLPSYGGVINHDPQANVLDDSCIN